MIAFSSAFMAHALTFSEIVVRSFDATKKHLATYVLGALLLLGLELAARFLQFIFFWIGTESGDSAAVFVTAILGVVFAIIAIFLQILAGFYAFVLAVERKNKVMPTIKKALRYFFKFVLAGFWIFLRSFAWLSLVGIPFFFVSEDPDTMFTAVGFLFFIAGTVCAVIFMPRFSFTNIIQLQDKTKILKSTQLSFDRTRGYWGKIVGNGILLTLCVLLTMAAAAAVWAISFGIVAGVFLLFESYAVAALVGVPLSLVCVAVTLVYFFSLPLFTQMYMVELYETIHAHPRKKKK